MEALQSIGQFFARWLAQLETTFVEKQRYLLLVDGLKNTLIITAGALVIGVVIGSLVAMIKYCGQDSRLLRPLCWLCNVYTTVIRGIPVVVQLLIFYFLILKSSDGLVVGIVTFGINSGAYVAVQDLTRAGNLIRNNTYDSFNPLMLVAVVYLVLVIGMTQLLGLLERRLRRSDKR